RAIAKGGLAVLGENHLARVLPAAEDVVRLRTAQVLRAVGPVDVGVRSAVRSRQRHARDYPAQRVLVAAQQESRAVRGLNVHVAMAAHALLGLALVSARAGHLARDPATGDVRECWVVV